MPPLTSFVAKTVTAAICALLVIVLATGSGSAQDAKPLKGVALAIGEQAYESLPPLPTSERDARAIGELLTRLGLATDIAANGKAQALRRSVDSFIDKAGSADVALLYYSGHAIEAGGVTYLLPTDTDLNSLEAADQNLISLQSVLDRLRQKTKTIILLVDANRSTSFPKYAVVRRDANSASEPISSSGLGAPVVETSATPDATGQVISFAADPRQAALEAPSGDSSPYAAALLKHLGASRELDFSQVMAMVTEEVYLATETRQRPWTSGGLKRVLNFGGPADAAAETGDEAALTQARRDLLLSITATPPDIRRAVENLARDQSLPLDPLYGMLKELNVDMSVGIDKIDDQLRASAETLKKILSERVVSQRKDPQLAELAGLADQAQAQGAIALAMRNRAKAGGRADDLVRVVDQRPNATTADRVELASIFGDYGDTAVLALDFLRAAEQYRKALGQVEGRSAVWAIVYRMNEADALANYGRYKPDDGATKAAISLYQSVVNDSAKGKNPVAWAAAQNNLGNALQLLAERTGNQQLATDAVAAFEATLTQWTHERFPVEWATTQNSLGGALRSLGEAESGVDKLTKAVAAYEAALTELKREQLPREWAKAQYGLGIALRLIGERQNDQAKLEQSLSTLETALGVTKRERDPLGWGTLQYNRANALQSLGRLGKAPQKMQEAIATYETALTELTRERVPQQWALIQNSLGAALQASGEAENDTELLKKAAAAYELALTVSTRQRVPLEWAAIQNNLGGLLQTIGERENSPETLLKAVSAYGAALSERTRSRVPREWAATQAKLGILFQVLGQRTKNTGYFASAVAAYESALIEWTRDKAPLDWATAQNGIGSALAALAGQETDTGNLTRAISAYRAALQVRTRDRSPQGWAETQNGLGDAFLAMGTREPGTRPLNNAINAYEAALSVWKKEDMPQQWATTQHNLGLALQKVADRKKGNDPLLRAVNAYQKALAVRTRESSPVEWAMTQSNLGAVLRLLAERERSNSRMTKAAAALEAALTVLTREQQPTDWATTQLNLGVAQYSIGKRKGDTAILESGKRAVQAAWDVYRSTGTTQYDESFTKSLKGFDDALAALAPKVPEPPAQENPSTPPQEGVEGPPEALPAEQIPQPQ
ncbi:caspase family protein [Taklimakanibacter lacteus]|uniref:caspase family protein n=1 Tax=Taklimakanibacter lacteus TaxID=2268456 RepID=UPI000E667546